MKYTELGKSDLNVSRICLGCMSFGDPERGQHKWTLSLDDSRRIIRHALDNGINFFDTAMAYQGGTSEEYVGEILRTEAKRQDIVLATKFHPRSDMNLSARQHVEKYLDGSLKRLGMDYIDLYILHAWDYHTPIEETLEAMNKAVKSGKVRAIGVSNCYAWQLMKANSIARENGWAEFVSIQGHHNLIFREEEREMRPMCLSENIAMTPYSALAAGRLSRISGDTKRLELDAYAKFKYDATADADELIIKRVAELAEKRGVTMSEISLAWLLTKVTSPIIGATKTSHIDGAVKAVELELTADEISYLEELYVPHKLVGVMATNR